MYSLKVRNVKEAQPAISANDELRMHAYAVVRNIPKTYHARHLRYFFADHVENERFRCFHYRHRPEVQVHSDADEPKTSKEYKRFCCVISFKSKEERAECIQKYHFKPWIDEEGLQMSLKCFIFLLKNDETTNESSRDVDFRFLIELRPPVLMPFGNVGTPTRFFLEQIRLCKLPPTVLTRLGIKARRRVSKYGAVCFKYNESEEADVVSCKEEISFSSQERNLCPPEDIFHCKFGPKIDKDIEDDDDHCEDWERHEALHSDVTEQERIKPKKYETEQEVTWEKGGPGLVWYTDAFFWNELEEGTDCDWKWADDWDVDYSVYRDRRDGDFDAKQSVEVLEDQNLRAGKVVHSVFKKRIRKRRDESTERPLSPNGCGHFEIHTKGIGSKIMKSCGWSPGLGLGPRNAGRRETVSIELEEVVGAQTSNEKKGLGYRGEKLQRTGFVKRKSHKMATKYDQCDFVDNNNSISKVLRTETEDWMKYR